MHLTKTAKVDDKRINEVAVKVGDSTLPWDKISPPYFTAWLDVFARAHGAAKELMFTGHPSDHFCSPRAK